MAAEVSGLPRLGATGVTPVVVERPAAETTVGIGEEGPPPAAIGSIAMDVAVVRVVVGVVETVAEARSGTSVVRAVGLDQKLYRSGGVVSPAVPAAVAVVVLVLAVVAVVVVVVMRVDTVAGGGLVVKPCKAHRG